MKKLPLPTKQQVEWADCELGVIIHFDLQAFEPTFINPRGCWGYTPSPAIFNPKELDTDQWLETAKSMGAKYAILVAKHCSGFSLWPTKAHDYSVKSTPWRDGKGDIVGDFIKSCKKFDVRPGIYCSASFNAYFKVNNPGKPVSGDLEEWKRYNKIVEQQLTELWSEYGKLFEIWFDGGVIPPEEGGPTIIPLAQKLQPDAVILGGPIGWPSLARTLGNERAEAPDPCWSTISAKAITDGDDGTVENPNRAGSPDGELWVSNEADMPNRDQNKAMQGGWFWREGEDKHLYSLEHLTERYFTSVGRNANMLVGMAIDKRGLVPEADKARFAEFGARIKETTSKKLAATSGSDSALEIEIPAGKGVGMVCLMEDIAKGERIRKFIVEALLDGRWVKIMQGTNIGHKRLERFDAVKASRLRLSIVASEGEPMIREFSAWELDASIAPGPRDAAKRAKIYFRRDAKGLLHIKCDNPNLSVRYALGGAKPDAGSPVFTGPINFKDGGTVSACAYINDLSRSELFTAVFGCDRSSWKVVGVSLESPYKNGGEAGMQHLLNDDPNTYWHSYHSDKKLSAPPHEITLDMGKENLVEAFTMMPHPSGGFSVAAPDDFDVYLSPDGESWELVASAKLPDLANNPTMRVVKLSKPARGRFIKFVGKHATGDADYLLIAGIGAILAKNPRV